VQARVGAKLTNDLETSSPHHCPERYKARLGIELFFKWLKQKTLKIAGGSLGRSGNAVKVQIFTALITICCANDRHSVLHPRSLAPTA